MTSVFQPSQTSGPTAPRSAAVSTYSICSISGEPTCTANCTASCSSAVSRRKARWFISMCLWTRNFSTSVSCAGKPSRVRHVGGDLQAHFSMVLQTALAQIVNQQRQVQQMLFA